MPKGKAEELASIVRHPHEPACPPVGHGAGKLAHDGQRFLTRGRAARQFDAFLVRKEAIAEAQMKEVARHTAPLHLAHADCSMTWAIYQRIRGQFCQR